MLLQISIVSIGAKADTLWRHESYWVQTQDHRYVCLRKLCVNSPHKMKEDTVFFKLTNMFFSFYKGTQGATKREEGHCKTVCITLIYYNRFK